MGTSLPPVGVRFQAQGVPQVQAAFGQVQQAAQRSGQAISRTFVTGAGQVTAFGRSSVQAITATSFAVSQLASTGRVGFRELASSASSFLAFFGAGGLIASAVIATGFALTDFWQRQKKEAREAANELQATFERFEQAADRRAREEDPVAFARRDLERLQARTVDAARRITALMADPEGRRDVPLATPIARARITRQREDARQRLVEQIRQDAKAIQEAQRQLQEAQAKATPETEKATAATRTQTKVVDDTERALQAEIAALSALGDAQQLTTANFARALDLHRQFATLVRDGTRAVEERAAALSRERALESAITIAPVEFRRPIGTTATTARGPAARLEIPAIDQARLRAPAQQIAAPITATFSQAFSQSLQTGLAAGVTSFVASGSIEGMWNTVGSAIVSGLAVINPWLAVAGGILQGLIGGLLGGGRDRRPSGGFQPLPVDMRRVINDPNFRSPIRPRPVQHVTVLGVNTPAGQRALGQSRRMASRRGV